LRTAKKQLRRGNPVVRTRRVLQEQESQEEIINTPRLTFKLFQRLDNALGCTVGLRITRRADPVLTITET
jgi:hypothetical protein